MVELFCLDKTPLIAHSSFLAHLCQCFRRSFRNESARITLLCISDLLLLSASYWTIWPDEFRRQTKGALAACRSFSRQTKVRSRKPQNSWRGGRTIPFCLNLLKPRLFSRLHNLRMEPRKWFHLRLLRLNSSGLTNTHTSRPDNFYLARATMSSASNHRSGFSAYHSMGRSPRSLFIEA